MAVTEFFQIVPRQAEAQGNGFTGGTQSNSDVIGLASGGYAVAYRNPNGAAGEDFPLFSMRNSSFVQTVGTGIPYSGADGIDLRSGPEMVRLADGNIAMVWDEGPGAAGGPVASNSVVGAIINGATGAVVHTEFQVSGVAAHGDPEIAALANGEWVVAMSDGATVFLQRMSATGGKLGPVIVTGVGTDVDPVVAGLTDGGFALAFVNAADNTVHVQTFNSDGTRRTDSPVLIGSGGANTAPAIAALPGGDFALVYDDTGWGEPGLSLHILSGGEIVAPGSPIRVDAPGATDQNNPELTVLPGGYILVAWENFTSDTNHDIVGRLFTAFGEPANTTSSPFAIGAGGFNGANPSIAHIRQGYFVTSWSDAQSDGSGGRITTTVNEVVRNAVGNGANDYFEGSDLREVFDGGGGSDTISYSGAPSRVYVDLLGRVGLAGDSQGDTYNAIEDVVGSIHDDILIGNTVANRLEALEGEDTLNGGLGTDTLVGGDGNDTYVNPTGDIVFEFGGSAAGTRDLILTDASYNLASAPNVEDITLAGAANVNAIGNNAGNILTGNAGANTLIGSGGNDRLSGLGGADTLNGGLGDDTYVNPVLAQGDVIVEAPNTEGPNHDRVLSNASFSIQSLPDVEDITLTGAQAINAIGNNLANILTGNANRNILNGGGGADTLTGGAGNDTMNGGSGADLFVFARTNTGADRIDGFDPGEDRLNTSGGGFSARAESGGNTTLTHMGGTILVTGVTGLSLGDWNALDDSDLRPAPPHDRTPFHAGFRLSQAEMDYL